MQLFSEWLGQDRLKKALLGLAAASAGTAGYLVSPNNPSVTEPEVTYNILAKEESDGIHFHVVFKNINYDRYGMPTLIRQYKKEAQDAVIDKILDDTGITFKVGNMPIRTAGINKLSFEKLNTRPDLGTLEIIMRQPKAGE
jgi:hypothetical protein